MRSTWALICALSLLGCGQEATEDAEDPKSRTNDVGPIERELRTTPPSRSREGAGGRAAEGRGNARPTEAAPVARATIARTNPSPRSPSPVADEPPAAASPRPDAPTTADATSRRDAPTTAAATPPPNAPATAEPPPTLPTIELTRAVVARAVEDREPVGAPPFAADTDRVFLFVEATNDGPAEATLSVEWVAPDGTRGRPIELSVPPAPRWRTWATTRRVGQQPGRWTAVVRHADRELTRVAFTVAPAAEMASVAAASPTAAGG